MVSGIERHNQGRLRLTRERRRLLHHTPATPGPSWRRGEPAAVAGLGLEFLEQNLHDTFEFVSLGFRRMVDGRLA